MARILDPNAKTLAIGAGLMHSADKTLLSNLGFQDPDKRNPDHDLACKYLSDFETAKRLVDNIYKHDTDTSITYSCIEAVINKRQYRSLSTVGFIDVLIEYAYDTKWEDGSKSRSRRLIGIEVKANPVSINDVIRQINTYKTFTCNYEAGHVQFSDRYETVQGWILATLYQINERDKYALTQANIDHIIIGSKYKEWCSRQGTYEAIEV